MAIAVILKQLENLPPLYFVHKHSGIDTPTNLLTPLRKPFSLTLPPPLPPRPTLHDIDEYATSGPFKVFPRRSEVSYPPNIFYFYY